MWRCRMREITLNNPSLVTGGCGFVGRNLVRKLLKSQTKGDIVIVDDLSTGRMPEEWISVNYEKLSISDNTSIYNLINDKKVVFIKDDFLNVLFETNTFFSSFFQDSNFFKYAYHFAAIVGGRLKIDGDPISVAKDLSLDAQFFNWAVKNLQMRCLYPSSSAAYPVDLQSEGNALELKESMIEFGHSLGQPDMTYGWSKLTGEYLAQIAAKHYGLPVVCIRPFSGYGEDQELSYPVPAITNRAVNKEDPFEVWGTGKQGRDFIHIEDAIDLIEIAVDKISDGRAYNISSGKILTFIEIINIVTGFAGYEPKIKRLLDKPVGVHARYGSYKKANTELGWFPKITVEEGLKRVFDHLSNKKKEIIK